MQGETSSVPLSVSSLIFLPGPPTLGAPQSATKEECSPFKLGTSTLFLLLITGKKRGRGD